MRAFFRWLLALFALGTVTVGCNRSADPTPAADGPRGTGKGQVEVTLYVPGLT
jgi:hypothetical protein